MQMRKKIILFLFVPLFFTSNMPWSYGGPVLAVDLPVFPDCSNIRKTSSKNSVDLSCIAKLKYPTQDVLTFYSDYFQGRLGWYKDNNSIKRMTENWDSFIDNSPKGRVVVHRIARRWINHDSSAEALVYLQYHSPFVDKCSCSHILPDNDNQSISVVIKPLLNAGRVVKCTAKYSFKDMDYPLFKKLIEEDKIGVAFELLYQAWDCGEDVLIAGLFCKYAIEVAEDRTQHVRWCKEFNGEKVLGELKFKYPTMREPNR